MSTSAALESDLRARAVAWAYANGVLGDAFPDDPIVEYEEAWLATAHAQIVMITLAFNDFGKALSQALMPALKRAKAAMDAYDARRRWYDPRAVLWREWVRFQNRRST